MSRSPKKLARDAVDANMQDNTYDQRLDLLRRSTGIEQHHVDEYQKTEVIRKAITGVRRQAAVNEVTRLSPKKLYSGVKSKVAGNHKSIRSTQKRDVKAAVLQQSLEPESTNPYTASRSGYTLKSASSIVSETYGTTIKSKLAKDQMESIINGIKAKYDKQSISNMSQEELQSEVLSEIAKSRDSKKKVVQHDSVEEVPESQDYDQGTSEQNVEQQQEATQESFYQEEESENKHDRMQQLLTSKAYDNMAQRSQNGPSMVSQSQNTKIGSTSQMLFEKQIQKKSAVRGMSPTKLLAQSVQQLSPKRRMKDGYFVSDAVYLAQSAQQMSNSPNRSPGRKSPKKRAIIGYDPSGPFEPDLNRAIARELYVDSTVNVVNPTGKMNGAKVKPGQMNLFNPKGQPSLGLAMSISKRSLEQIDDVEEREEFSKRNIEQIQGIYNDEGGRSKMRNKDLQRKTEDVQGEFEKLMNEMVNRRTSGITPIIRASAVDNILDGYYMPGPERKHKSPTKRLINLKNSTTAHKQKIQDTLEKGEYSQTYCIAPGKSYVIEAQGGELPYDIAESSPSKFYNQVLNQGIKKCSVKARGSLNWIITQRPLLKIISSIKEKVLQRLQSEIGPAFAQDINDALAAGGDIENELLQMVENQQIDLVDKDKNLVLQQQISQLTNNQRNADTGAADDEDDHSPVNIRVESPDARKLDQADLHVQEKKYSEFKGNVVDFVRRNSLLKDAQHLRV